MQLRFSATCVILACSASTAWGAPSEPPQAQGSHLALRGGEAVLTKLNTLPYVENDYSRRFKFDAFDNPKLKQLRERYRFDEVIA